MNRLTTKTSIMGRKHDLQYGCAKNWKKVERYYLIENAVDKLGELEDIEEELGISLPILFKALNNGIYARDYGWLLVEHFVLKAKEQLHCKPTYRKELRFALKDYKKTWWLKEDLKNE